MEARLFEVVVYEKVHLRRGAEGSHAMMIVPGSEARCLSRLPDDHRLCGVVRQGSRPGSYLLNVGDYCP